MNDEIAYLDNVHILARLGLPGNMGSGAPTGVSLTR
jgi:hypothetical protein